MLRFPPKKQERTRNTTSSGSFAFTVAVSAVLFLSRLSWARPFGTLAGYDSGGSDSMCWITPLQTSAPGIFREINDTDNLLDYTSGTSYAYDVAKAASIAGGVNDQRNVATLLSSCYPGTRLSMKALDLVRHYFSLI
jgi:hypothetical protein